MKKYNVCVTEISHGSVNVEAKNKQDAKDKALEAVHNGMAIFGGDCDIEIESVEEELLNTCASGHKQDEDGRCACTNKDGK